MAVAVATHPVEVSLALPLARATREALADVRDAAMQSCGVLRERRELELDAEFRIGPNAWVPRGADSTAVSKAVRQAAVVLEAIVDTTGQTDPNSIRILRNGPTAVIREARDALLSARSAIEQPQPGCKVRHLLILPYMVSAGRP